MPKECYKDKYFSVLGDSISTLWGYTEPQDATFYDLYKRHELGILTPSDTWWGRVIELLGAQLLVNNSISGSTVVKISPDAAGLYGCSDERTASLSRDGINPDVIMVFLGINDWGYGVPMRQDYESEAGAKSIFAPAYEIMIKKLKENYPDAEIWCFTLPTSVWRANEQFRFPLRRYGKHINDFCEVIREIALKYSCRVIDLYQGEPHDTIDGYHPNREGMITLADYVISIL